MGIDLLAADDGDRHHRNAGPHGDLDEAAPAESAQPVALGKQLARAFGALGEDQHQLLLVAQQPVGVVGMGGHAAGPGPQRCRRRDGPEQVVGQAVHGPAELLSMPCMITGASAGMAPAWLATSRAPP